MSGRIHDTAAAGFSAGSGAYARGRPSYPAEAVEFLAGELHLRPGRKILDLAAGTGKFTALLVPTGDVQALARGIETLLTDRALAERLGRGARRRYETYHRPQMMAEAITALFEEVASARSVRTLSGSQN